MNKYKSLLIVLLLLIGITSIRAEDTVEPTTKVSDDSDFTTMYLGRDKFENYNRKMFLFNGGLNKYVLRDHCYEKYRVF